MAVLPVGQENRLRGDRGRVWTQRWTDRPPWTRLGRRGPVRGYSGCEHAALSFQCLCGKQSGRAAFESHSSGVSPLARRRGPSLRPAPQSPVRVSETALSLPPFLFAPPRKSSLYPSFLRAFRPDLLVPSCDHWCVLRDGAGPV